MATVVRDANLVGTASEKCQQEKRKTVNGEDILFAMTSLGFENYAEALKVYLSKYREVRILGRISWCQCTLINIIYSNKTKPTAIVSWRPILGDLPSLQNEPKLAPTTASFLKDPATLRATPRATLGTCETFFERNSQIIVENVSQTDFTAAKS